MLIFNLKGFSALKSKLSNFIYFICLGLGFIFMEIILIQKYILILGYPVYSFGIVTAGLLLSSGLGSLISNKFTNPKKAIFVGLIGILLGTLISMVLLKYIGVFIIGLPFWLRITISLALIGLNGLFMGFMFPSGIRLLSEAEESIPWMYSINSIFSVTGSYSAIILSILFGFDYVLFIVIGLYIIAAVCRLLIKI